MKYMLSLVFMLASTTVAAKDCYEYLTADYSKDSHAFQVNTDYLDVEADDLNLDLAIDGVRYLLEYAKCKNPSRIIRAKSACMNIAGKNSESLVCYLKAETDGYYIVNKDYLENLNIIFNRYD